MKAMGALTTKADVLTPFIALLVGGMAAWVVLAVVEAKLVRAAIMFVILAIFLSLAVSSLVKVWNRARRIVNGFCPYPMCKGVVQRPANGTRGIVVCPTCKRRWPEVPNIKFKVTSRLKER